MTKIPTRDMEFFLLGWNESHHRGCTVTFQLSEDDLAYFRHATTKRGKVAGQRYAAVLVEVGAHEEPVKTAEHEAKEAAAKRQHHKFPEGRVGLAVRWCRDEDFRAWLAEQMGEDIPSVGEERAAVLVRQICVVDSRKQLDEAAPAKLFDELIREPYAQSRRDRGIDET